MPLEAEGEDAVRVRDRLNLQLALGKIDQLCQSARRALPRARCGTAALLLQCRVVGGTEARSRAVRDLL